MRISVVNHTNGRLSDEEARDGIEAVNRQITRDFTPRWHLSATLRLDGAPGEETPPPLGDGIIYLWGGKVDEALGHHVRRAEGIPFGFVFTELSRKLKEAWTVTLSHEALELIANPAVNLLVAGPHPIDARKEVFHWYEVCDAVQDETYDVDGAAVSNFLLPHYFTLDAGPGGRSDFLGRAHDGGLLRPFSINPGGCVGFFNPETGKHETFALRGDTRARQRMRATNEARLACRATRHKLGTAYAEELRNATPPPDDRRRPVLTLVSTRPRVGDEPPREVVMLDQSLPRSARDLL